MFGFLYCSACATVSVRRVDGCLLYFQYCKTRKVGLGRACRGSFVACLCSLLALRFILVLQPRVTGFFFFRGRRLPSETEALLNDDAFGRMQEKRFNIEEKFINSPTAGTFLLK